MAYIDVTAFKKLRAFLWGLQKSGFNLERIPFKDEQGTPIDKESSLKLLHSLPDFQKEEFKDDNAIVQYLKKRSNFNQTLDQFTPEQQNELTKALEEKPATAGGEPVGQEGASTEQEMQPAGAAGSSAGGMPGMGMPSAPVISAPRFIHNVPVPHAPEPPKPDIAIANKSGVVVEAPPSEFHVTDKAGNIQATYSKEPLPAAPQSKLIVPGTEKGDISKLVTARGDGAIVKPITPTPKIAVTDSRGNILREHTIKPTSRFSALRSNIGSKINIGINKGINKAISGINNFGKGGGAGNRSIFGRIGGIGKRGASKGSSMVANAKKRSGLIFAVSIIGFMMLTGMLAISSTSSTGEAAPIDSTTIPTYQPGAGKGIISCPLNNATTITNGSVDADGHCSKSYEQDYGVCAKPGDINYTGKETAIDVTSSDRWVHLPKLGNSEVVWTIGDVDTNTNYIANGATVNGGYSVKASTLSAGKVYEIRFVHIESTTLQKNQQASSGTPVGQYRTQEAHVHITIKEDREYKMADKYFNLCSP